MARISIRQASYVVAITACGYLSTVAHAADLFSYRGKTYSAAELSPAEQQAVYQVERESYEKRRAVAEAAIFKLYLEERAKKAGKSASALEAELLKVPEPSDKEAEAWFKENQSRLPGHMSFQDIKAEIKSHLQEEARKKRRAELVEDAKRDAKAALLFSEPTAPSFNIATQGWPTRGAANAKVTLVEFADYQCPHCQAASKSLDKVMERFGDRVKLVFIDFPVNPSGISRAVAEGAVCAGRQGKYWEYHHAAFAQQRSLNRDSAKALAKELQLDTAQFDKCLSSGEPSQRVASGEAEGRRLGISGTPTIFLNGKRLPGYDEKQLVEAIETALKKGGAS